jgi:hypothetical protein
MQASCWLDVACRTTHGTFTLLLKFRKAMGHMEVLLIPAYRVRLDLIRELQSETKVAGFGPGEPLFQSLSFLVLFG